MESVRSLAQALCYAAVAGSLTMLLAPGSSLGRVVRMAVVVFFLCAVALPLRELSWPQWQGELAAGQQQLGEELSQEMAQLEEELAGLRLEEWVQHLLEERGINPVSVTIHITEDGQNASARVILREEDAAQAQEVQRQLEEEGFSAQVEAQQTDAAPSAQQEGGQNHGSTNENPLE